MVVNYNSIQKRHHYSVDLNHALHSWAGSGDDPELRVVLGYTWGEPLRTLHTKVFATTVITLPSLSETCTAAFLWKGWGRRIAIERSLEPSFRTGGILQTHKGMLQASNVSKTDFSLQYKTHTSDWKLKIWNLFYYFLHLFMWENFIWNGIFN